MLATRVRLSSAAMSSRACIFALAASVVDARIACVFIAPTGVSRAARGVGAMCIALSVCGHVCCCVAVTFRCFDSSAGCASVFRKCFHNLRLCCCWVACTLPHLLTAPLHNTILVVCSDTTLSGTCAERGGPTLKNMRFGVIAHTLLFTYAKTTIFRNQSCQKSRKSAKVPNSWPYQCTDGV